LLKVLHSQGTWKLAKCRVCVRNGYDGDSEIVSELARHTALLLLMWRLAPLGADRPASK